MTDRYDWQKHYPPEVKRQFEVPLKPLWRLLEETAQRTPEAPAIFFRDYSVSYRRLWKHAEIASAQMRARGYGNAKGAARVLLWLPNCPEFVTQYFGALRAGCIVTAASMHLTAEELSRILADTDPTIAIIDMARALEFDAAVRQAGVQEPRTYYLEPGKEYAPNPLKDSDLLPSVITPPPPPRCRPELDVAVLQYTSGTTGGLKAAMMSHRNLVANALQNNHWFGWTEKEIVLGALPLYHTWGMCCVMNAAIAAGASIALIEHFQPQEVLETLVRHKVTVAYGSATMFLRLLDAAGSDAPRYFESVRYVKAGAMLVSGMLPEKWRAACPKVPMINGYGLTEASPEVTNNPPHAVKYHTVGVPLPGTEVRLADPENPRRELERGKEGEVQVRGPQVMLGYWNQMESTHEAIVDGWLRTGDLGKFDEEGYLRIVDRLKDLIKFRGYSIYPSEVEKVLLTHPAVAEACVVGMPDPIDGEVPVAFLVFKPGAPQDITDLPRFVEPHLASFKRPRRFHIVSEIPKNAVGKPLKRVLRQAPEPVTGKLPKLR
ncbi:MAG TPA: AMP-binding protein [Planctomycetota bacterium]|nr:AMP-binding protein [Planctomycetota bacterium]